MKSNKYTSRILVTLLISVLFLTSCKKDEVLVTNDMATESVQKSAEIDVVSDNVSSIVEEVFIIEEGLVTRSKINPFLPECMTKTVVISGFTRSVTLDFGDGCEMHNGNYLSGIITIEYVRDPEALTRTITYAFTNFFFNYKNIEGGGSIFRERMNENENPQSTKDQDITITWPNGDSAHRVGVKVREWIEGVGSGTWGDNVFLITGNWTTDFPNGAINTGLVTTPLRRELACRFIVSGVIALTHNDIAGTLDFGDGTCDNQAIFTDSNGVEHLIILD